MTYNQKRVKTTLDHLYDARATYTNAQLASLYKKVLARIEREMTDLYRRIDAGDITSVSQLYTYNKYYELVGAINSELSKLGTKEQSILTQQMTALYNSTSSKIDSSFALSNVPATLNAKVAVASIWAPDGIHFSDRIWKSQSQLIEELLAGIVDCVASGRPSSEISAMLHNKFGVSFNNASRLVRTELSHIQNVSAINRYKDAGVSEYEVIVASQNKLCPQCKDLANRKYLITDTEHLPPQHPNCRCVVVPVVDSWVKNKE